jgi:NAD(P)-dependent dehydrogenase (short-subunit alcohol dehydrogenase family)
MDNRPELRGTQLFDLSGRVAIVTGGGRGLGRVIALALAAAGADVAASARSNDEIAAVAEEIRALGRRAIAIRADITREADCELLAASAEAALGRIDILVNNAGVNIRKPALDYGAEELRALLETNLLGAFLCARAVGRRLVAQRSGKVINVSSILGHISVPGMTGYSASKGGLEQLTKVLALEWAEANVQVNAIAPAYLETDPTAPLREDAARNAFILERTPMRRWGKPHEVCGAVLFLASDASSYVTGHSLLVDGGWTAW